MNESQNAIAIAVLQEQIHGIREQQKAHAHETKTDIAALARDVKDLLAVMNRGRGAYAASLMLAGLIGGVVLKSFGLVAHFFQR